MIAAACPFHVNVEQVSLERPLDTRYGTTLTHDKREQTTERGSRECVAA